MNIPESIKVLYRDYAVIEKENLHDGDSELFGQVADLEQVISLNKDATREQKEVTLLHEAIHALDALFVIELSEAQVEKLAIGIYMLVLDNPMMFAKQPIIKKGFNQFE